MHYHVNKDNTARDSHINQASQSECSTVDAY